MIEFGKTLREAREAKGYGVSQLAEMTHILPQIIENLEREDFTKIVAPIYGRGFVKLYCEHVGIDPKPLIAEFMDIYNGNRPPVIRMRETFSAPKAEVSVEDISRETDAIKPEEPETEEMSPPKPEPVFENPTLFEKPLPKAEPFNAGPDDLPFPEDPLPPKRDYRLPGYSMPDVPRRFWRFGILIVATLIVLLLVFFGCRALYRMTMGTGEGAVTAEKVEQVSQQRKGVEIPPLYID